MKLKRIIGSVTAVVALSAAGVLYAVHPVKSSDHQDTYNLALQVGHNASADITDVFVYPAPDNANNVVFAMDVWPLIPVGLGATKVFDPTILWQFKIAHGATNYKEDEVIQLYATGATTSQVITLYGPAKPNEVSTANTLLKTATGSTVYNTSTTTLQNSTVKLFAGPRADSFVFDLLAFYTFLGDRNYGTHTSQTDPGAADNIPNVNGNLYTPVKGLSPDYNKTPDRVSHPSFNGFVAGNTSVSGQTNPTTAGYACSVGAASNTLKGFDVLSFVVEVPKSLIENGYSSHVIHVWATASSSKVKS